MAFTYDATTDLGKVRLLISDVNREKPVFQDEEIEAFLALNSSVVKLAAATGLEVIASNEVMVSKVITLLDLKVDGAAVAKQLLATADRYRKQANEDDGAVGFGVVQMNLNHFWAGNKIENDLREI